MITLGELLSYRFFKDFRFATTKIGLSNTISATGFFEWESGADIKKTFRKGEFVVTTLSIAKDNAEYAERCLEILIANGASAIAVKDIYFKNISGRLKKFAEKNNVPVLFFSDIFVDDLLFNVRILLLQETNNPAKKEKILKLIRPDNSSSANKIKLINNINPYFIDGNIVCAYITEKTFESFGTEPISNDFAGVNFKERHLKVFDPSDTVYMFIRFDKGLLLIYTGNEDTGLKLPGVTDFLKSYLLEKNDYMIGISSVLHGLENMDKSVKEALYANTIAIIDNEPIVKFDATLPKHTLCPLCYDPWMKDYFREFSDNIENNPYREQLLKTLTVYVECEGDINLTSKRLFQHNNTIRYRLSKIKSLLNIKNDAMLFYQAYTYIHMKQIKKLLDPIFGNIEA